MSNTTDYQPPFQPPQIPPQHVTRPKKRRRWVPFIAYPVVFFTGLGIGAASGGGTATTSSTPGPGPTVTITQPAKSVVPPTSAPAEPTYGKPAKGDFKLTVKMLTKECFGSAGCNVTYRILISYTGPDLEPGKEYEVLYEVRGGEDGPVANKFTVTGDESSVESEEMVSTRSSKTKLTAVVTDVL